MNVSQTTVTKEKFMTKFKAVRKKLLPFYEKNDCSFIFHNTYVDMFFYKNLTDGEIFKLENEYFFVKISSPDLVGSPVRFRENNFSYRSKDKFTLVADRFKDDSDLEYIVDRNHIKENIIIRSAQKEYSYNFFYDFSGLTLHIPSDGSCLEFINECAGRAQFRIPKPVMYDGANISSDSVYYEIEMLSAYSFILRAVADANWINSPERVFPVTIDPEMRISGNFFYKFR